MPHPPYDPRAIANLLLDTAEREPFRLPITHVALQKLLYFAHGRFLIRTGRPLVSGAFEAWSYGPVHPGVYHEFKGAGRHPITFRATQYDVVTGAVTDLPLPDDDEVDRQLAEVLSAYGKLSPGRLIEISHAPRGPWATIVNKSQTSFALGMRIPDTVTKERFKYLMVPVGPSVGEPDDEDSPLA